MRTRFTSHARTIVAAGRGARLTIAHSHTTAPNATVAELADGTNATIARGGSRNVLTTPTAGAVAIHHRIATAPVSSARCTSHAIHSSPMTSATRKPTARR